MECKHQQPTSSMPEVNLIPMMDVILTILTFFILVAISLTTFQAVDASLPTTDKEVNQETPQEPLIISMTKQRQIIINNAIVTEPQIAQHIVSTFQKNPKGSIVLKADKSLAYEKVVRTLGVLRDVGGDRVSLAIE